MCFEAAWGWGHSRTRFDQGSLAYLQKLPGSQRVRVSMVTAVVEENRGETDQVICSLVAMDKAKGSVAFIRRGVPEGS
jgi:hypothetical protein